MAPLAEAEGTVASVLKLGVQRAPLLAAAERLLGRSRACRAARVSLERVAEVLDGAEAEAERLVDEFASVEHVLMALAATAGAGAAQRLLAQNGTHEALLKALAQVRAASASPTRTRKTSTIAHALRLRPHRRRASGKLDSGSAATTRSAASSGAARRTKNNPVRSATPAWARRRSSRAGPAYRVGRRAWSLRDQRVIGPISAA